MTKSKPNRLITGSLIGLLLLFWSSAHANDDFQTIKLLSRVIDPAADIERTGRSAEELIQSARNQHLLIQLRAIPSAGERAQLAKAGIQLLDYVPNNAWFARISDSLELTDAPVELIRWAGRVQAADKISPALRSAGVGRWALAEDGSVTLQIAFFKDVASSEIADLLAANGALDFSGADNANFIARFPDASAITRLAGEDRVQFIDNGPSPRHPRDVPPTNLPRNQQSRDITRVNALQTAVPGANGSGTHLAVFDGGVDPNHQDFAGRLWVDPGHTQPAEEHGTHVAGTMAGSGAVTSANRGVATAAQIYSYDNQGDFLALHQGAIQTNNADLSQNSWGGNFTSQNCDTHNIYSTDARNMDRIVTGEAWTRGIVVSVAASNFRTGTSDDQAETDPICNFAQAPDYINYTSLSDLGSAKNILSVGATQKVATDRMADFSSWGPTRDGRLKPDLVAPGEGILSTFPGGGYGESSGTSMSTPHVSGVASLVIQRYREVFNNTSPRPATVRAIMTQTARDLNSNHVYYTPGPDFASGYGMVNAEAAYNAIVTNRVLEREIANGATDELTVPVAAGQTELKVTLGWDDPVAAINAATQLVNNLDLELVAPNGTTITLPWVLDSSNPAQAATRGVDSTNNLEQVLVENPTAGDWTIRVKGTAVPTSPQKFSLVSSFAMQTAAAPPGSFVVSTSVEGDGSVSPTSANVVQGQTTAFTLTPANGGSVESATGCGGSLQGTTYTTGAITAACTVSVTFSTTATPTPSFLVSTSVDGNGSISPTSANVLQGQTTAFTLTPATGSSVQSATGCGGSLQGTTFTTGAISAACTVSVVFSTTATPTPSFLVSASVQGNGSISPTSANVLQGQTTSFTLIPAAGENVLSASGCGGTLAGTTFTTGPISGACSISVTFSQTATPQAEPLAVPTLGNWSVFLFALIMLLVGGFSIRLFRI